MTQRHVEGADARNKGEAATYVAVPVEAVASAAQPDRQGLDLVLTAAHHIVDTAARLLGIGCVLVHALQHAVREKQKARQEAQACAAAHGLGCRGASWIGQVVSDGCQGKELHRAHRNSRIDSESLRRGVVEVFASGAEKQHVAKGERQRSPTHLAGLADPAGRGRVIGVE